MTRAVGTVAVFVAALLLFAVHNLVSMADTQERLTCIELVCERPRDIQQLSALNRHTSVSGRLAHIYYLGQHIPGAKLTIPPSMAEHRWHLERVARLRVEISDAPMLIDLDRLAPIDKRLKVRQRWLASGGRRARRVWQPLVMVLEGRDLDYVIAETGGPRGTLYVLSAARYQAATEAPR